MLDEGVCVEEGLGLVGRGEGGSKGCGGFEVTRFFGVRVLDEVKVGDFRVDGLEGLSKSCNSIGESFGVFSFPEEEETVGEVGNKNG